MPHSRQMKSKCLTALYALNIQTTERKLKKMKRVQFGIDDNAREKERRLADKLEELKDVDRFGFNVGDEVGFALPYVVIYKRDNNLVLEDLVLGTEDVYDIEEDVDLLYKLTRRLVEKEKYLNGTYTVVSSQYLSGYNGASYTFIVAIYNSEEEALKNIKQVVQRDFDDWCEEEDVIMSNDGTYLFFSDRGLTIKYEVMSYYDAVKEVSL